MSLRAIDVSKENRRPAPKGERPDLAWVRIDALRVNEAYQRPIESRGRANIRRIADHFDWNRFSPLLLARIDKDLYAIIDGQHRAHAAAICGVEEVPALVTQQTDQEQAASFAWVNGTVTALTPIQIYRAALAAMEPWAVQCNAVVERAGCRLMTSNSSASEKKPGEVYCVTLVRRLVEDRQSQTLAAVLEGLMANEATRDVTFFGGGWLRPLVAAAHECGVTRGGAMAEYFARQDLWKLEASAEKLRLNDPRYRGQPKVQLLTASLTATLRAHIRGDEAA